MWTLALIPLAGVLNRVRGGFLPTGSTQLARAIFAVGMGVMLALGQHDWRLLTTIPLWFAGEFMPNGDYLGMTSIFQFLEATAVGIANVLLVVLCMAFLAVGVDPWFGPDGWALFLGHLPYVLLICGACKGLCYLVAKYIPSSITNFHQGAEMAELLFGLVLGVGVVL